MGKARRRSHMVLAMMSVAALLSSRDEAQARSAQWSRNAQWYGIGQPVLVAWGYQRDPLLEMAVVVAGKGGEPLESFWVATCSEAECRRDAGQIREGSLAESGDGFSVRLDLPNNGLVEVTWARDKRKSILYTIECWSSGGGPRGSYELSTKTDLFGDRNYQMRAVIRREGSRLETWSKCSVGGDTGIVDSFGQFQQPG